MVHCIGIEWVSGVRHGEQKRECRWKDMTANATVEIANGEGLDEVVACRMTNDWRRVLDRVVWRLKME